MRRFRAEFRVTIESDGDGSVRVTARGERGASVAVVIPPHAFAALRQRGAAMVRRLRGEGAEVGGFFDAIWRGVKKVAKPLGTIVRNPFVKAVVGIFPGGGTVLTAVDAGARGIEALKRIRSGAIRRIQAKLEALKKGGAALPKSIPSPKAIVRVVEQARAGDPKALVRARQLASVPEVFEIAAAYNNACGDFEEYAEAINAFPEDAEIDLSPSDGEEPT